MYEDLLAPGLQRARRELANFPAVQKALARFETPVANVRLPDPPFLSICHCCLTLWQNKMKRNCKSSFACCCS